MNLIGVKFELRLTRQNCRNFYQKNSTVLIVLFVWTFPLMSRVSHKRLFYQHLLALRFENNKKGFD